jgi:drug/metabolite transporter (DMT)-like permease
MPHPERFILGVLGVILILGTKISTRESPRQTTDDIVRSENRGETVARIANGIGAAAALLADFFSSVRYWHSAPVQPRSDRPRSMTRITMGPDVRRG